MNTVCTRAKRIEHLSFLKEIVLRGKRKGLGKDERMCKSWGVKEEKYRTEGGRARKRREKGDRRRERGRISRDRRKDRKEGGERKG